VPLDQLWIMLVQEHEWRLRKHLLGSRDRTRIITILVVTIISIVDSCAMRRCSSTRRLRAELGTCTSIDFPRTIIMEGTTGCAT